jgi:hypothetical protein
MTKDDAIETCAKAITKGMGYREESWRNQPQAADFAKHLVAALEALGLVKLSG